MTTSESRLMVVSELMRQFKITVEPLPVHFFVKVLSTTQLKSLLLSNLEDARFLGLSLGALGEASGRRGRRGG